MSFTLQGRTGRVRRITPDASPVFQSTATSSASAAQLHNTLRRTHERYVVLSVPSRRPLFRLPATREDLAPLCLTKEETTTVERAIVEANAAEVGKSVKVLTAVAGSASAARALIVRHPNLLCCQLPSWVEFLTAFGLSQAQIQHVLCQTPEALVESDLERAGQSILTFRRLGLNEYGCAQLITYYPQLLCKSEQEIRQVLDLLGRYQTGIDTQQG